MVRLFWFCAAGGYNPSIMNAGKFIVIEGTDGSGKATQCALLVDRLRKEGQDPWVMDFPRYHEPSAYFVQKYLNGGYGSLRDSGPKRAALFYALDRFDASPEIWAALREGRTVVSNRYIASSMGHQGSKIENQKQREEFFRWLYDLEYDIFGIPKPDLNIFLHIPAETAYDLIAKKAERKYLAGGAKRDIAESDMEHLKVSERTYEDVARLFPSEFAVVECAPAGQLLSPEEVHAKVWAIVENIV